MDNTILAAMLFVALMTVAVALFRRINRDRAILFVTDLTPERFDALAAQAAAWAYDGAEQLSSAYETMSDAEKQRWAAMRIQEFMAFVAGHRPPRALAIMWLEAYITRKGQQGVPAPDHLPGESR